MRILFLAASAQELRGAGGRTRIVHLARRAAAAGHDPHLVCLVPLRRRLRFRRMADARRRLAQDAGCPVTFLTRWPAGGRRGLQRVAASRASRAIRRAVVRTGAGLVHAHGAGVAALALETRIDRPVIADLHGAAAEEYRMVAGTNARYASLRARDIEVLRRSDACLFVSDAMRDFYREVYGATARRDLVLPCATDPASPATSTRAEIRARLGAGDGPVFAYVGSWRPYQCAPETVALFDRLRGPFPDARLLVLTSHVARFRAAVRAQGLPEDAATIRTVEPGDVAAWLDAADIGFLLRHDDPVNRVASPTKCAEYLAAGVPVVLTPGIGDFSTALPEAEVGHVQPGPAQDDGTSGFVSRVLAARASFDARCRAYARAELSWETVGGRIATFWHDIGSASKADGPGGQGASTGPRR